MSLSLIEGIDVQIFKKIFAMTFISSLWTEIGVYSVVASLY